MSKAVPEADATPDEAFELGQVSGYDKGYADALGEQYVLPSFLETSYLITQERARQIAKGYTVEHDAQHGVVKLLEWSARFAEHGQHIKAAAMVEAARAVIGIGYVPPQTEDEQSEEDREALDQYDGPTEIDSHDLPDDYDEDTK